MSRALRYECDAHLASSVSLMQRMVARHLQIHSVQRISWRLGKLTSTPYNHYNNVHARTIPPIQISCKFIDLQGVIFWEVGEPTFQGERNIDTAIGMKLNASG
jgi:hypothetical protein